MKKVETDLTKLLRAVNELEEKVKELATSERLASFRQEDVDVYHQLLEKMILSLALERDNDEEIQKG